MNGFCRTFKLQLTCNSNERYWQTQIANWFSGKLHVCSLESGNLMSFFHIFLLKSPKGKISRGWFQPLDILRADPGKRLDLGRYPSPSDEFFIWGFVIQRRHLLYYFHPALFLLYYCSYKVWEMFRILMVF